MSDGTKISWADATWSPLVGCDKVSRGCDHCYAIRNAHRMAAHPNRLVADAYAGVEAGGEWTGNVNLLANRLDQPLRWRKPRRIFVNAQSDLFHKEVPDDFIARVFAVMALAPQIVGVSDLYVFVLFVGDRAPKATPPGALTLLARPTQPESLF